MLLRRDFGENRIEKIHKFFILCWLLSENNIKKGKSAYLVISFFYISMLIKM